MVEGSGRAFIKHVKGLFHPDILKILREKFIALEANPHMRANITEREKNALERGESADVMRMQDDWYNVWRKPSSKKYLLETISPFTWVTYPVQVRHVKSVDHNVPWHQDIGYMRLLGGRGHQKVITCFVPLEFSPSQCTTIQFARDNFKKPDYEYPHTALSGFGAGIKDTHFNDTLHYDLNLGDALVFGDFTLHRTYTPENCQVDRRSLEFRLIMPEDAIQGKDYFDTVKQNFLKHEQSMEILT